METPFQFLCFFIESKYCQSGIALRVRSANTESYPAYNGQFWYQIFRNHCWWVSSRLDHRNTSQHNTNTSETFVVVRSCGTNVFWTKNSLEVDSTWVGSETRRTLSVPRELRLLVVVRCVSQPTANFKHVFRPENVSAATSNHNERFWRVCVVLRGVAVVQTRRNLPAGS